MLGDSSEQKNISMAFLCKTISDNLVESHKHIQEIKAEWTANLNSKPENVVKTTN